MKIYSPLCQIYQLLFKSRFPKRGPTYRRQVVNDTKRRKGNQLQSLKLPSWIS